MQLWEAKINPYHVFKWFSGNKGEITIVSGPSKKHKFFILDLKEAFCCIIWTVLGDGLGLLAPAHEGYQRNMEKSQLDTLTL